MALRSLASLFQPAKFACLMHPRVVIVFRDSQGGYGDLALAAWAYEEARSRGLGQEITTE